MMHGKSLSACLFLLSWLWGPAFAGDGASFDPLPILVEAQGVSGVPIGTVIAWPSASLPPATNGVVPLQAPCVAAASDEQAKALGCEWLEADGSTLDPAAYPELAAIFGTTLPDYRGLFLRGRGSVQTSHFGMVTHASAALGQIQGDSMRDLSAAGGTFEGGPNSDTYGSGCFKPVGRTISGIEGTSYRLLQMRYDPSLAVPTANEIRPVNRSVVYLIRVR